MGNNKDSNYKLVVAIGVDVVVNGEDDSDGDVDFESSSNDLQCIVASIFSQDLVFVADVVADV